MHRKAQSFITDYSILAFLPVSARQAIHSLSASSSSSSRSETNLGEVYEARAGCAKTQTMARCLVNTLLPWALEHLASVSVESGLSFTSAVGGGLFEVGRFVNSLPLTSINTHSSPEPDRGFSHL